MFDRRKRVLNSAEMITHAELERVVEQYECCVYTKVRLADALNLEGGDLTSEEYNYALKSHFDFIVARGHDTQALFGVEYDAPLHRNDPDAERRDKLKDSICDKLTFPLLRVDADFLYQEVGQFRLLPLLIEVWFLGEAFYEQQAKGHIPLDEIFSPYSVIGVAGGRIVQKYHPAQNSSALLHEYYVRGMTRAWPVYLRGHDKTGRYAICLAIAYVQDGVLMSTGCFRSVNFGYFLPEDLAEDIATIDLAKKTHDCLKRVLTTNKYEEVEREFHRWDFGAWQI